MLKDDIIKINDQFTGEEMVEYIQSRFKERQEEIHAIGDKFAKKIHNRYGDKNYPLHMILKESKN